MTAQAAMSTRSKLRPHAGQALVSFAKTYPKLIDVVLEVLQNAIDSNPKNVHININMNNRTIVVDDDGDGVSVEKFETALEQVGMTIKGKGKLGRFGRGLVSPLGKCAEFVFTSCPKRNVSEGYRSWTFVCEDIASMKDEISIPQKHYSNWLFSRKGKQSNRANHYVSFRTRMSIKGIIEDRAITRLGLDSLNNEIIEEFGTSIRKKGISVWIYYTDTEGDYEEKKVEPPDFMGRALDPVVYTEQDSGDETRFRMFVTPLSNNGRKGRVSFGEVGNDFRVSSTSFLNAASDLLDKEVVSALRSGVFEGEILGKKVNIHPDRKKFEMDDALVNFCICINSWYNDIGSKEFQEIISQNRDLRHQKLGLRSMRVIEKFLDRPEFQDLVKSFTMGSIGDAHTEKTKIGEEKRKSLSLQGGTHQSRNPKSSADQPPAKIKPKEERPGHIPKTVAGPEGKIRTMVRSNSTGLQLSIEELPGKRQAFELDKAHGVLRINSRHPHFAECEGTDTGLMRYFETISAIALTSALYEEESEFSVLMRESMEHALELLVFSIAQGDRLSGRRKGSSLKSGGDDGSDN